MLNELNLKVIGETLKDNELISVLCVHPQLTKDPVMERLASSVTIV
jgi:hypothetical protein